MNRRFTFVLRGLFFVFLFCFAFVCFLSDFGREIGQIFLIGKKQKNRKTKTKTLETKIHGNPQTIY